MLSTPKSIDVLVARYGGAHYASYQALCAIVEQQQLPWQLNAIDVDDIVERFMAQQNQMVDLYKALTGKRGGELYTQMLKNGQTWLHPVLLFMNQLLVKLNYSKGVQIFTEFWRDRQPDLVISTLPLYNKVLWNSLQQGKPGTPAIVIPVDFGDVPPGFYIEPETGSYIACASEKMAQQARALGVKEELIVPTSGLMIHPRFYQPILCDRASERERLGLDPHCLTGIVMFGGYGSKVMLEIAKRLEKFHQSLQLIFICGRNEELATELNQLQGNQKKFVVGFTQDIPYYMHLADFFIGKAGGSSISEALAMKLPIIVESNNTILKNERLNADWIQQQQVGVAIRSIRDIDKAVAQFIDAESLARYQAKIATVDNCAVFEMPGILQKILANSYKLNSPEILKQRS
ncbi:glycosyltransferase [Chroococcidiopsis sp. TS-821]|uniref:glycosyltransferase n=1 Tax=Chroococcidiopsis sp. TS-821 TaxID=1378066 RepID=UPI000CEE8B3E|nr:glycosyltransferase [Chroococcidiopsis sp. TS-821]PPS43916.1 hypothetical protein B1A85_07970 [Chroococcidiopsis sp. TS-821]